MRDKVKAVKPKVYLHDKSDKYKFNVEQFVIDINELISKHNSLQGVVVELFPTYDVAGTLNKIYTLLGDSTSMPSRERIKRDSTLIDFLREMQIKTVHEYLVKKDAKFCCVEFDEIPPQLLRCREQSLKERNAFVAMQIYEYVLSNIVKTDFFCSEYNDAGEKIGFIELINYIQNVLICELFFDNNVMKSFWTSNFNILVDMMQNNSFPGISDKNWISINEKIIYFDAAFEIADSSPELYKSILNGEMEGIHFAIDMDDDLLKRREGYMLENKLRSTDDDFWEKCLKLFTREMKIAWAGILAQADSIIDAIT